MRSPFGLYTVFREHYFSSQRSPSEWVNSKWYLTFMSVLWHGERKRERVTHMDKQGERRNITVSQGKRRARGRVKCM